MRFLILFLISFSAMATNVALMSEVEKKIINCDYVLNVGKKCQGECIKITKDFNCNFSEIADEEINDKTKPVHSKSEIEICSDQTDCETKNVSKVCADLEETVKMAIDFSDIYCTKFLRYEQKLSGRKIITINEAKKSSYESIKLEKSQLEAGIQIALNRMNYGKRVIALLLVRNASKSLKKGQIKQMNSTYSEIKGLLETGSLETAIDEINLITPDGTIVTDADKTALVSEINKFLAL